MADNKAKVGSIELIDKFHKELLIFSEEALSVFDSIRCEIHRYKQLIENEIPARIQRDMRKWETLQKEAKMELSYSINSSKKLAATQKLRYSTTKLKEAQDKFDKIKKWQRQLPAILPTPVSTLTKGKTFLVNDMAKAANTLQQYLSILDDYTSKDGK